MVIPVPPRKNHLRPIRPPSPYRHHPLKSLLYEPQLTTMTRLRCPAFDVDAINIVLDAVVLDENNELLDVDPHECNDTAAKGNHVDHATPDGLSQVVEADVEEAVVGGTRPAKSRVLDELAG